MLLYKQIALALTLILTGLLVVIIVSDRIRTKQLAAVALLVRSPFTYQFSVDGVLEETGSMNDSSSPYWWLNSGGRFILSGGTGKSIFGELPRFSKWRILYSASNPVDTDDGYHPQNILRLLTRSKWQNLSQQVYIKITQINLSNSPERNAWSGVLLLSRYQDSDNLYYAGIRMDGHAIIKKKVRGVYYTMAEKTFYSGTYNRETNPNLIPTQVWIGVRSEIKTNTDGSVTLRVSVDRDKTGNWIVAAEATDTGKSYGGAAIINEGYAGLRTDFMDVEFDDFKLVTL